MPTDEVKAPHPQIWTSPKWEYYGEASSAYIEGYIEYVPAARLEEVRREVWEAAIAIAKANEAAGSNAIRLALKAARSKPNESEEQDEKMPNTRS